MNPLRTVVVATDLSAPSRHAAQRAAMLARAHGAAMTLVHALGRSALDDLRRWLADGGPAAAALEDAARRQLQDLAAECGAGPHAASGAAPAPAVATHLGIGHPVELVVRHAEALDADLLVTGTRGAGFFRGVVVGSTAERIARRSARPVLMVRQLAHEPYRRVLVPVDFSPHAAAAVALARRVAPDAKLVLMHALELPFEGRMRLAGVRDEVLQRCRDSARAEARQRLAQLAADAGLDAQPLALATPDGADPWMLILQQEQEHDCDLVVIGRQGRHALDEFLLGSTTRRVLAEGQADVLVASAPPG